MVTGDENGGFLLAVEIPSDPELLCVVRSAVQQLVAAVGLPEEECRSVTLAVDEAVANVIRLDYRNSLRLVKYWTSKESIRGT